MKRLLLASSVIVFSATAASAQTAVRPAAAAVASDSARAGSYALELNTENGTIVGGLELKRVDGKLEPTITVMGHSPTTKSFTRNASEYTLLVAMGDDDVTYKLKFVRDSLFGTFVMPNNHGTVMGARKP